MSFAHPLWLWGLAILPASFGLYWRRERRLKVVIAKLLAPRLRAPNSRFSTKAQHFQAALLALAIAFLFVALARPQAGVREIPITTSRGAAVIALDVSRSMLAEDVKPSRLGTAKLIAMDLVNDLHGFEIGVMAYAGEATMLAPLTFERDFLLQSIREAGPNNVSRGGTNFSNAFYEAVAILGPMTYSPKLLFLLTDGEDLEGDAAHVAKQARDAGIQIIPIAIGTEAGAPIVVKSEDGSIDYVRDLSGKMVLSKMRPGYLADLAKETDGQMITATDRDKIQSIIRSLKQAKTATTIRHADEWFWVPLGLAFLTASAGLCINTRKGLTIKNGARSLAKTEAAKERKKETVQQGTPA